MAPSTARSWPEAIVYSIELWYGALLLVVFVISIALNSILDSRRAAQLVRPAATGPGGRPLPATRRRSQDSGTLTFTPDLEISTAAKRVYGYGYALFILSFAANFASVITHTVYETKNPEIKFGWWCGEETSVSHILPNPVSKLPDVFTLCNPLFYVLECMRRYHRSWF